MRKESLLSLSKMLSPTDTFHTLDTFLPHNSKISINIQIQIIDKYLNKINGWQRHLSQAEGATSINSMLNATPLHSIVSYWSTVKFANTISKYNYLLPSSFILSLLPFGSFRSIEMKPKVTKSLPMITNLSCLRAHLLLLQPLLYMNSFEESTNVATAMLRCRPVGINCVRGLQCSPNNVHSSSPI